MKREIDNKKDMKEELGKLIKLNREKKGETQRGLAKTIDLPNSNLKYIEDGINAPSPKVYKNIILFLKPSDEDRGRIYYLYSQIRGTPPPDICEIIMKNPNLYGVLRTVGIETKISDNQVEKFAEIISIENRGE